jgi:hypothetical protein
MDNQLNKRVSDLEQHFTSTDKRLARIEKLLTNHFVHLNSATTFWMKLVTPTLVVLTPMVVAFFGSQFAVDLLNSVMAVLRHTGH